MVLKVKKHTSDAFLRVRMSEGKKMISIDRDAFKAGCDKTFTIKKGQSLDVSFPIRPQIVLASGSHQYGVRSWSKHTSKFEKIAETTQFTARQVFAHKYHVMFLCSDNSIWGMGYRV